MNNDISAAANFVGYIVGGDLSENPREPYMALYGYPHPCSTQGLTCETIQDQEDAFRLAREKGLTVYAVHLVPLEDFDKKLEEAEDWETVRCARMFGGCNTAIEEMVEQNLETFEDVVEKRYVTGIIFGLNVLGMSALSNTVANEGTPALDALDDLAPDFINALRIRMEAEMRIRLYENNDDVGAS